MTPDTYPRITVYVVTLPPTAGINTALGVTTVFDDVDLPLGGSYITSSVHVCGSDRVVSCARSLLAGFDGSVEQLRRDARWLHQRLSGNAAAPAPRVPAPRQLSL